MATKHVRSRTKSRKKSKSVPARSKKTGSKWWHSMQARWFVAGFLLLTFVVYFPTFSNDFTNWDDDVYVTNNPLITSLSGDNLATIFSTKTFVGGNYHPLTVVSLAINYQMTGLDISSYHWTNILLHLLNTFLVFLLIYRLTKRNLYVSAITALVFGIHPMHVESVSWIAERKDVLYTCFFLASSLVYLDYRRNRKTNLYILSIGLFILSLLSKPAAVVLPVLLILLDYFIGRKMTWQILTDKIPFFILSGVFSYLTLQAQAEASALGDFEFFTPIQKFIFASYGFVMYIIKFIIPTKLSAFYPYPKGDLTLSSLPIFFKIAPIIALAIAGLVYYSLRKSKVIVFGMLFYLITIALVLQFISVGSAIMADRYTYVPFIGIAFLAAYGFDKIYNAKTKQLAALKPAALALLVIFTGVFSYATFQRTKVWNNNIDLWTNCINNYPNSVIAFNNRGHHYRQNNMLDQAMADYNRAIDLDDKYWLAYSNRGKVFFELNDNASALRDYNTALEIHPDHPQTLSNRGAVKGRMKDYEGSAADLQKALELDPNYAEAYYNLGAISFEQKDYSKAVDILNKYLVLKPENANAINTLAVCYQYMNQHQQALSYFSKSIQLAPNNGSFYLNRSFSHFALQDIQSARQDAQQAQRLGVKVDPSYMSSLGN